MTKEYIKKGFECDKEAKKKVVSTLKKLYADYDKFLAIDLQEDNPTAGIDLYLTAASLTEGVQWSKAAIEIKERPDTAHTDCPDWIIEPAKVKKLKQAEEQGYKPLYCYVWGDNYMALWDVNNWDYHKIGTFKIKPHTMGYAGEAKKTYEKYGVSLSSAIWQGEIVEEEPKTLAELMYNWNNENEYNFPMTNTFKNHYEN